MENTDRDDARDEADQTSEQDQPPIVLNGKTGENAEHPVPLHRQYGRSWAG
jgi:hypothetical protein